MTENNQITHQLTPHANMKKKKKKKKKKNSDDSDLEVLLLPSLEVDSSPRLLWCVRFLDVHVEPVDRTTALVHRWFP